MDERTPRSAQDRETQDRGRDAANPSYVRGKCKRERNVMEPRSAWLARSAPQTGRAAENGAWLRTAEKGQGKARTGWLERPCAG